MPTKVGGGQNRSQNLCCYIARYYVKQLAHAPGGVKNICPLSWGGGGGGGQNRSENLIKRYWP